MATLQELQTALTNAETAFNTATETYLIACQTRNDTEQIFQTAKQAFNDAVAAGVQSGSVGSISSVSALLLAERNAGIQGAATFIQTNHEATQEQVIAAWTTSAKAVTNLPALLQDPNVLFMLYATNLQQMGAITDTTWASVQAWIIATPLEVILAD